MLVKDFIYKFLEDEPVKITHIDNDSYVIYDTVDFWLNRRSVEEQEKIEDEYDSWIGETYYVWYVCSRMDKTSNTPYIQLMVETYPK